MKKVIILIDGQNLFYTLKSLKLIEKDLMWDCLFKSIIDDNDELIRVYWFRPQRILDTHYTRQNIRTDIVHKKYRTHLEKYKTDIKAVPKDIINIIEEEATCIERWLKEEKEKFSSIEYAYDQLSLSFDDIEIVKTGILKVNPYKQEITGEKGVDIALAVKMISLSVEKKCDKIILISGDYDYAEAVKYTKNNMTKIHIVKFHKGVPPKNKSVSRDLAVLADKVIDIYESDLEGFKRKQ
ncbi:MAG: NYN domain-containing protein [Bacteroidales bacterium]|jgi:uncharacterized LabA/DUF88 family protein|nr:NYN domain-containing protein [Bacteroidales bacterium]